MSFLVLVVLVCISALFYLVLHGGSVLDKGAELARLIFAAAVFALLLSIALGTHDAILRVVK